MWPLQGIRWNIQGSRQVGGRGRARRRRRRRPECLGFGPNCRLALRSAGFQLHRVISEASALLLEAHDCKHVFDQVSYQVE